MAEVRLVAGLGNPGRRYVGTRHNVGFEVIDRMAAELGAKVSKAKFGSLFGECEYRGKKLILVKPTGYMNRSGEAVATVRGFYRLEFEQLLLVTDDMALDCGRIRLRAKGSSGGHNGLQNVIERLGNDEFGRLRVGIGASGPVAGVDYVLGKVSAEQADAVAQGIARAAEAAFCWADEGIEAAMNRYNG